MARGLMIWGASLDGLAKMADRHLDLGFLQRSLQGSPSA